MKSHNASPNQFYSDLYIEFDFIIIINLDRLTNYTVVEEIDSTVDPMKFVRL